MNRDQFLTAPYSAEAEASVLSALLLDNESIHRVPGLEAEAFYVEFHADIFRAIQALAVAGKPFDIITVYEQLGQAGKLGKGDEMIRLNDLAQYVPSASNLRRYAEIVGERFQSRGLLKAASEISDLALAPGKAAEQINAAQMLLAKLATVKNKRDPQHINQSLSDYLSLLTDLSEGKNPAIPTGIEGLDRILNGGIRRGEMMVIGARPKHGKTALALALARNMARDYGVLFISQEMPVMQLMHRHTAAMGTVDLGRILRADASDAGMWERVTEAAEKLGQLNLVHDDQSAQSLMDIRRKALQVKRQHGLDVLFVDFLQLMQGAGEDNRNRELDVISNGLKALAMDLQIGVVVLSQMSRKADAVKREKLKSRSEWAREAQAAFNAFIRARDADLPCISCGRHHQGQYHAGHYLSVGARPELRFVELNVAKQCAPCNTHLSGNAVMYRKALVDRIGTASVDWLEGPHPTRHYSVDDLREIKKTYAAKARELLKAKA